MTLFTNNKNRNHSVKYLHVHIAQLSPERVPTWPSKGQVPYIYIYVIRVQKDNEYIQCYNYKRNKNKTVIK